MELADPTLLKLKWPKAYDDVGFSNLVPFVCGSYSFQGGISLALIDMVRKVSGFVSC